MGFYDTSRLQPFKDQKNKKLERDPCAALQQKKAEIQAQWEEYERANGHLGYWKLHDQWKSRVMNKLSLIAEKLKKEHLPARCSLLNDKQNKAEYYRRVRAGLLPKPRWWRE